MRSLKTRHVLAGLCLVVAGLLVTQAAWASFFDRDRVRARLTIAVEEAEAAQRALTTPAMQRHLQRVVNCLTRSGSGDVYPKAGNPCTGPGPGVIADLQTHKRSVPGPVIGKALDHLMTALDQARQGINDTPGNESMGRIRRNALHVSLQLRRALDTLATP